MKTTQTFSVQFIARTKKLLPEQALIYARITVCRKAVEISLKRNIIYAEWNRKAEYVSSKTLTAKQINNHIENCRYRLMESYQQLLIEHKIITAEKIKSLFLGEMASEHTLLGLIYDNKHAITAADALNDRVLPFFEEQQIPVLRMLTDRGSNMMVK